MIVLTEKKSAPAATLLLLYALFFASLIFSWRAVSSISTGLLIIAGLVYNRKHSGHFFPKGSPGLFSIACCIYFGVQAIFYFSNDNTARGWQELVLKTGLVFVPLVVYFTQDFIRKHTHTLQKLYCALLLLASLFCLGNAVRQYTQQGTTDPFFYHALVGPLKHHAVYFSILVYVALLLLLEGMRKRRWFVSMAVHSIVGLFFGCFLVLLASKLVITFFFITLLCYVLAAFVHSTNYRRLLLLSIPVIITGVCILFLTRNPVSSRFRDMLRGDLHVVEKKEYQPDVYFNGLQFRLLQWKLVPAILREQHAWLYGTGAGHSQDLLNRKYSEKKMYMGAPGSTSAGYGLYNTHNQWLESLLKNGILGLIAWAFICSGLFRLAMHTRSRLILFTALLLFLYSFAEALIETQYGLIIFVFFPLFFSCTDERQLNS